MSLLSFSRTINSLIWLGAIWVLVGCKPGPPRASSEPKELSLVQDGQATSVLVLDTSAGESARDAAQQFVSIIKRSTGAEIEIVATTRESEIDASLVRIFVGDSPAAAREGLTSDQLEPETYRLLLRDNKLFVIGAQDGDPIKSNPGVVSRPTLWALNHLLEKDLGVRWLWPGDLGTYVPEQKNFAVSDTETTYQPKLEFRSLRLLIRNDSPFAVSDPMRDAKIQQEAIRWAENHLSGSRSEFVFGHSFGGWWHKYSNDHPDYFAELPEPHQQPFPQSSRVKLRLSNPAVIEQIAQEYIAAGSPNYYNVCPNDGRGFDISEETRAWDIPENQPIQDIFSGRANLTARYVKFWNLLYERLRQINPDVTLLTYTYSAYRLPPPPERPLTAKTILQIVDTADAYDNWKGWAQYAYGLSLRPNWWHYGADAPYLPLEPACKFIRFAFENRMLGMDMDSILGYWATQGVNYYLAARLMTNPDLSLEEILNEYTSAFGKGAPKIREYLDYWQKLTAEYNYNANATDSRYQELVRTGKVPRSVLNGSKYALPYLYTDEVLTPATQILEEADRLIGDPGSEAARRVAFLRKGLKAMLATREQIARGQKLKVAPTQQLLEEFKNQAAELENLRTELSEEHIVWGEATRRYEERYQILLRPSALEFHTINLDGLF